MEFEVGLPIFIVVIGITGFVMWTRRARKPVFDSERRELRYGKAAPIPFRDLEVRVFRYRREEEHERGLMGQLAAGTEEVYQVYVRAGNQRVDLSEFRSKAEAEEYADKIRATITEG